MSSLSHKLCRVK